MLRREMSSGQWPEIHLIVLYFNIRMNEKITETAIRYNQTLASVIPPVISFMVLFAPKNKPTKMSIAIDNPIDSAILSRISIFLNSSNESRYPGINRPNASPIIACKI